MFDNSNVVFLVGIPRPQPGPRQTPRGFRKKSDPFSFFSVVYFSFLFVDVFKRTRVCVLDHRPRHVEIQRFQPLQPPPQEPVASQGMLYNIAPPPYAQGGCHMSHFEPPNSLVVDIFVSYQNLHPTNSGIHRTPQKIIYLFIE